ncbi:hypothetical protein [Actibacterium sp. 188UL27-1]|uniref:hypothetical protein n=1 Tax=Actibacterium sp. 188UL27-1 TaxID=2786961 RepID=UPI001959DAD8|nr:hypothetical protein [Actibacterium sp. 188UL27-1]MBM7068440.1 hypothetical protein [Actibacterium sp. 188UL27-1]
MSKVVLGIHSNVTSGDKTGGHAWISITTLGRTTCYGLWPDEHGRTIDNGSGTDIRRGLETIAGARASRYYELTPTQAAALHTELGRNVTWNYTHNCSSWASDVIARVVGEDVDADDMSLLGAESPRQLGASIRRLETRSPTSRMSPVPAGAAPTGSSAASSW